MSLWDCSRPKMNCIETNSKSVRDVVVIDRRNPARRERSAYKVSLIEESKNGIVFLANWRFPVPAVRRRYFLQNRELAVEECGMLPKRDVFQFSGVFLR